MNPQNSTTLVSGNPWHQKLLVGLRGKTLRKLCCFTTHNDFFCILARRPLSCLTYVSHLLTQNRKQKSIICCFNNRHNQSKMATFSCSKSWFFRALHENNIALNIRRILMLDLREIKWSLLKLYGYSRKAVKVFRGVGRFCKKAPQNFFRLGLC